VPALILLALALVTPLVVLALMPLGLVQRYRTGTARRVARGWVAALNVAGLSFSALLFIAGAAVTSLWVPNALSYSLVGLAGGCLLGWLGLALTRWERASGKLYYTPNRFLVLVIILVVIGRLAYGVWRLWQSWRGGGDQQIWLVQSAVPGSLAAGAIVLGYSLTYSFGVSRRTRAARRGCSY
jgi:hypothetical protein